MGSDAVTRDTRSDGGWRFRDRQPDDYPQPDLNPYMKLHRTFGPPVLTATEAAEGQGRWPEVFGRDAPLHLEIGSGNGFFLAGMASRHPEWNWLGIEIRFKRVILVARKLNAAGATHARIARYDAFHVEDLVGPGEVAGLYVNHPDPWPKDRHARNRLLARPFAEQVARMLAPGAALRVKTDQGSYVAGFLEVLEGLPLEVLGVRDDVAREGTPWPVEDDVVTNYQRKFLIKGLPVHALWVRRTEG